MVRTWLALLLILAAACGNGDPVLPDEPTFALDANGYWAGAELVIESEAFRDEAAPVSLRLGATELSLTRAGATRFTATVPSDQGLSGIVPIVTVDGDEFSLPAIAIFGRTDATDYAIAIQAGGLIQAPSRGGRVLAVRTGSIDLIDLVTKSTSGHPWTGEGLLSSPGPTPDPAVWILGKESDDELQLWNLSGEPTQVGILQAPREMTAGTTAALLTEERLLFYSGDGGGVFPSVQEGVEPLVEFNHEGDRRVIVSPIGTRAAMTTSGGHVWHDNPADGWYRSIPVFDLSDGSVAWELTNLGSAEVMDFSPDGSKLAVLGRASGNTHQVLVLDAATGTLVKDISGVGSEVRGLGYDSARGLLYVVRKLDNAAMEVVVVSPHSDYQVLGRMTAPCARSCYRGNTAVVTGRDAALYVVEYDDPNGTTATRFSLPSTTP